VFTSGSVGGAVPGEVTRLLRVGFETRLTVRPSGSAGAKGSGAGEVPAPGREDDVTVVLTRSHAREMDLDVGSRVWLAPNRGATMMPVVRAV
jgi:sulfate/thiosulfate transport system ATP-binding protein